VDVQQSKMALAQVQAQALAQVEQSMMELEDQALAGVRALVVQWMKVVEGLDWALHPQWMTMMMIQCSCIPASMEACQRSGIAHRQRACHRIFADS